MKTFYMYLSNLFVINKRLATILMVALILMLVLGLFVVPAYAGPATSDSYCAGCIG